MGTFIPRLKNFEESLFRKYPKEIHNNTTPIIYGDGEQKRDFVNVKDIVEANILALNKKNIVEEVFNVGSSKPTSINRLLKTIKKIMNKNKVIPVYKKARKGDVKDSFADLTKIGKRLDHKPKVNLEDGLIELISCYSK